MYLFNGLDRSNVGNAATVDFVNDLGTDSVAVNNAVTCFYATCELGLLNEPFHFMELVVDYCCERSPINH